MSIQLSSHKDVDVQLKDSNGKEVSINDLDLELHLSPQQLIASSMRQNDNVKYRVKHMLSRLKKPNCQKNSNSKSTTSDWYKDDENVVYIKNKITLKDSVNGTEFDVEMDLKVEIEDPDQICAAKGLGLNRELGLCMCFLSHFNNFFFWAIVSQNPAIDCQ